MDASALVAGFAPSASVDTASAMAVFDKPGSVDTGGEELAGFALDSLGRPRAAPHRDARGFQVPADGLSAHPRALLDARERPPPKAGGGPMRTLDATLQQFGEFLLKVRLVTEKAAPFCVRWVRGAGAGGGQHAESGLLRAPVLVPRPGIVATPPSSTPPSPAPRRHRDRTTRLPGRGERKPLAGRVVADEGSVYRTRAPFRMRMIRRRRTG